MTIRPFLGAVAVVALGWSVEIAGARVQGQRALEISITPSTPHPGDVARVDVSGVNGDELTGSVLGQALAFHYDEGQQKWRALVGIDLDTKPGAPGLYTRKLWAVDGCTLTS